MLSKYITVRILILTALFSALAYLTNNLHIPFFFGVDFIFGSIVVMLGIVYLGFIPGVIVALASGVYTLILWGHPYAMIGFVCEAIFVGLFYKKFSKNLVLTDMVYWIFIGSPLAFYLYTQHLGMSFDTASFIALKQPINGIFNTLIAGIIILLLERSSNTLFKNSSKKVSLDQVHFYVFLVVITLTAGIPIIYDGYAKKIEKEQSLYTLLSKNSTEYFEYLNEYADLKDQANFSYFHLKDLNFKLQEVNGEVIYQQGKMYINTKMGEILDTEIDGLKIWLPSNDLPTMKRWKTGIYYVSLKSKVKNEVYILTIESFAKDLVEELESNRLKPFISLSIMMLFGVIFSYFVSRWMSGSIHEIAQKSKKISNSILENKDIAFTPSHIEEYDDLQEALQVMAKEVLNGIEKLNNLNDTLEQKVSEQTKILHQKKERYETLMKYASDGVFILDLNGKVVECSNVAAELLGYSLEEMHELYVYNWDIYHEKEIALEHIKNTPYEPLKFESVHKRKDGSIYDASIISVKIKLANKEYIYASVRDITNENRHAKELSKAKEHADAANAAKSNFLASMSHEIRTPMTGLLGFIQRLKNTEKDSERIKQFTIIENSGQTLLSIINDILDFSKIESGKIELDASPYNIHRLFSSSTDIFRALCSSKNISLHSMIDESLPVCLIGDEIRLKQIIFNLLGNAIKFTSENGNVTLNARYDDAKQTVSISVIDTGIGIAKQNLDKIFEAFSQEDVSTTRKFGGTGLGLSISSHLVKLMGSELKVESKVGEGSKFYFEIPTKVCLKDMIDESIEIDKEIDTIVELKGHVLIVEDNKTNQMLMKMILDDLGLTYDVANHGAEAVLNFKLKKYDVILMDENMPIMNGIEAAKTIRKMELDASLKPIPIIAVTANALTGDKEKFIDAGMDDYIPKPYIEEDIVRVLKKYLG